VKQLTFAIAALALGCIPLTAARADYAVVQFGNGDCRIWWDSGATPWGDNWRKVAIGLPDWDAAAAALDSARFQNVCP
jgi:hypothetical protein